MTHTKEFNVEHTKAGAPYCQRNGLAARIGIWDREHVHYKLVGVAMGADGGEALKSWTEEGKNYADGSDSTIDLVMLPLGYCEGKPVFVGDELFRDGVGKYKIELNTWLRMREDHKNFDNHKWPRTEPLMPSYPGDTADFEESLVSTGFSLAISKHRQEIEAYWKQLDEYNGVNK